MALRSLDVTLKEVRHHKPSQWNPAGVPFLIGITSAGQTIKGEMRKPVKHAAYRLWGEWRPQKNYPGDAFEFSAFEPIVEQTTSGFDYYLANFVDGLGPVKSAAIVDTFGMDSLKVLRETPERALEVKGITPEIVESIRRHFEEEVTYDPAAYAQLVEMFKGHKIPRRILHALLDRWKSNAPEKLREQPYMLLSYPRMGWKTVDGFAMAIGYPAQGMDRQINALVEAVEDIAGKGHTYAERHEINAATHKLIGGLASQEAWDTALKFSMLAENPDGSFSLPKLAYAERTIAERLALLAATAKPLGFDLPVDGLLPKQQEAVKLAEPGQPFIISGPPGTGKTYCVTKLVAALIAHGLGGIRIVAPTGKAAKRAAELLEKALPGAPVKSTTIHKALGPIPSTAPEGVPEADSKHGRGRGAFTFSHNEENPINANVIICDEASLLDAELAADLLRAIAPGTLLIFVGDPYQLPSVGPGSVLRDLIAAGIPTAKLTEVQRNCGTIVQACHDILKGVPPKPAKTIDLDNGQNWIHLEIREPSAEEVANGATSGPDLIAQKIVGLCTSSKTFDPYLDQQVISPEKDKPGIGCKNLNRLLSDALNKWKKLHQPSVSVEAEEGKAPEYVVGDKIVRTKNGLCDEMREMDEDDDERPDWQWGDMRWRLDEGDIVNGDMGEVVDIVKPSHRGETYVVVDLVSPRRRCRLPFSTSHLSAAFAMTCHKAQGSGFPYVILPVHHSFFYDPRNKVGTWIREMLYTMFSRAEILLVTVGQYSAIEAAVSRPTVGQRKTRLRGLIATSMEEIVNVAA